MKVAQASRLWAITHDFHIMWAHRRDAGATPGSLSEWLNGTVLRLNEFFYFLLSPFSLTLNHRQ